MKRSSQSRLGRSRWPQVHRPKLELLERRLPPGDALWSLLLGGSPLALDIEADSLERSAAAIHMEEEAGLIREISRPEAIARIASGDDVAHESLKRAEQEGLDSGQLRISSPRTTAGSYSAGMNRPAFAGAQVGGLAARGHRGVQASVVPGRVHLNAPYMAGGDTAGEAAKTQAPGETQESEILDNYGKLPLSFEQNVGQFDERVDFVSRGGGSTLFLTPTAAVFAMQNSEFRIQNSEPPDGRAGGVNPLKTVQFQGVDTPRSPGVALHMQIVGGNPDAQPAAADKLPGITNYFIGNDPSQWRTNISSFGRVEYDEVYPGIDLAYYGNNGQLEYDFIVSPGADPSAIALNFAGADGMEINPKGDLVVHTAAGDVVQQKPFTYQDAGNSRHEVASGYVMDGGTVRYQVGSYDQSLPLVIDPVVLGYSTFLGGSGDDGGTAIVLDADGNAYVTGGAASGFPTTPGAFDTTYNGLSYDVFVAKLNPTGTALAYSTYLGGNGDDAGLGIALDTSRNAFVTGISCSPNFPTINGSWDTGNVYCDAFVTKVNATGSALSYSTFLGGSTNAYDYGFGIALDGSGNAYVTGRTEASDFPTTPGSFDTTYNGGTRDAFVTKLNAAGSALVYSTFLGGSGGSSLGDFGAAIAVDGSGNAYVAGETDSSNFPTTSGAFDTTHNGSGDAFGTKLNASGSALVYSTFLGGTNYDSGHAIALDGSGNAYVTGQTYSTDSPTTPGAFDTTHNGSADVFVSKLNASGSALVYSTFLGGANSDNGGAIALDGIGNAYVTGSSNSINFPLTPGAFETTGGFNSFVTKLNAGGSALTYSTLLGGIGFTGGTGLAIDAGGDAYVIGSTDSSSFPTTPGALDMTYNSVADAFVTKLRVLPGACLCFDAHPINTGTANSPNTVFAADLDGDGDTDALSASNYDAKIAWYENDGIENFTPHVITTTADQTFSVTAADVDSDGDNDVLFASAWDHKVSWWANNGSGSFTEQPLGYVLPSAMDVFAADIDSDGDTDILGAGAEVVWYENNGSEVFSRQVITTSAAPVQSVIAEDVDQDGDIDVLTASPSDNKIAWYENNGSQTFTVQTISPSASGARSVHAGDLDGDGDIDILSASINDDKIAWYETNGSESFTARTITTAANGAASVFPADLDNDGDLDVMSASQLDDKIAWYENTGNGSFVARSITTAADGAFSVFAADVDGDNDLDILSASAFDDKLAWYENISFQVVNTNDSGTGSLRQAIIEANVNPGVDTITFDIGSGVQTIAPTSSLPLITDPVVIDGTTQPGYAGTPLVVLSGANNPNSTGLSVFAGGSTIQGLVINGFTGAGIALTSVGGNLVVGNYIGTNAAGTAAVGNGIGVDITSASNTVGGTTTASRNLISGNGTGIVSSSGNVIQGNYIGTDATGTSGIGNINDGVFLSGSNNLVGGTTAGAGNRIAFNGGVGVAVNTGIGNAIRQNIIYSNGGLGIDQTNGGNNNQAKPSVNLATSGGGSTTITTTLVSAPTTTYTLDFFSSASCDPSTFGEGETYLGSKTLTTKSTGRGRTIFVAGVQVPLGHVITATATSPGNDTSEFSKCWAVT